MNAVRQRLKSKTYWAAIIGAILSIMDVNGVFVSGFFPAEIRPYLVMIWPVVMITVNTDPTGWVTGSLGDLATDVVAGNTYRHDGTNWVLVVP